MDKLEVMTPYGFEQKSKIKPFGTARGKELHTELNNTEIIINSIKENKRKYDEIERCFCRIKDIKNSLKRSVNLEVLDEVELYEIKYFSMVIDELIGIYKELNIDITNINFQSLEYIFKLLDPENKKIPTFYIYDKYSERLRDIRKEKTKLENKIFFEEDEEISAALKESRLDMVILEEEEELRIKKLLSEEISKYINVFKENIEAIGSLDLLMAKSKLAIKYNAVKPELTDNMEINLEGTLNPEISEVLKAKDKTFTSVSLNLKSGTTVITGANMGGKSVTLKTMVLNVLLGQMGFFVFCKKAAFPVVDFIYFISDDMQNISKGLSTFGAEIIKLSEMVECVKKEKGFLVLDEFARGTNPREGFYLVASLCKYLNKFNSISVISTHYDGVVQDDMTHYQVVGLKNVNFNSLKYKINLNNKHSVEIIQENMEYRLEKVGKESMVPKDALKISMLLGLDEEILDIAKDYYKAEK
ncbi:hypothetical protein HBE96_09360 [Clostridium sp. P21]|uniref:DNA mismatch repair proteins mutS family domain-containing protein n=2 Tax=Clostridium muellerianum TaxID=2716538 RepID=A0A7Y0EI90_9CLOT|nr:hypothetical protein [Clostridium muellerianum]NMM62905.1 hypothetical protein [Clostridium muellerianum]